MAIAAESFTGRFLAAVSRRAPAFRPAQPLSPARLDPYVLKRAARVQAAVKGITAAERLEARASVRYLSSVLTYVAASVERASSDLAFLASEDYEARLAPAWRTQSAFYDQFDRSPALRVLKAEVLELLITVQVETQRCADTAFPNGFTVVRSIDALSHGPELQVRLAKAADVMADVSQALQLAANDFSGADLSHVRLEQQNLAWLRWDASTRWPTGWAERIRQMSLETAPGGFVVQPVDADDRTESFADV
jgi:hypothetical protein